MLPCFHASVTPCSAFLRGVARSRVCPVLLPFFFSLSLSRLIHLSRAHSMSSLRNAYALNTFAASSRCVCCTLSQSLNFVRPDFHTRSRAKLQQQLSTKQSNEPSSHHRSKPRSLPIVVSRHLQYRTGQDCRAQQAVTADSVSHETIWWRHRSCDAQ